MKYCVIGIGCFGSYVATLLAENGIEVLALDKDELKIEAIRNKVTHAVCINVKDESALRAMGVDDMDTVIISMGKNFSDAAILTRMVKHNLKVPMVITRTTDETKKEILELIGADQVILPEHNAAFQLVDNLVLPFPHAMRIAEQFSIMHCAAPHNFINKTIQELHLADTYNLHCIAVQRGTEIILPKPETIIEEHDILYLAGDNKHLADFFKA